MPEYRRAHVPGGVFFFTVVTEHRSPILVGPKALHLLRQSFAHVQSKHPFEIDAAVILPDHAHFIWTLPEADADFSTRWRLIKSRFTFLYETSHGPTSRSTSKLCKSERGVWQRRFWEHWIRDLRDYERHIDYIHFNPVKHGLVSCPHHWTASSFVKWVRKGVYPADWRCDCGERRHDKDSFDDLESVVGEPAHQSGGS